MQLNRRSLDNLRGVHPHLVAVVKQAAALHTDKAVGFIITCGVRSVAEQKILVAKGASKTMNSRHIPGKDGLSKAVDFAVTINGVVKWDWPLYAKLAKIVKQAATECQVPIKWGGDWKSFKDGPHFQLPAKRYP